MRAADVTVRPLVDSDWAAFKQLRLEMLADTPIAFLETLAAAQRHPDQHWQRIAAGRPGAIRLVAETPAGALVGTMGGVVEGGGATLVAVYVAPPVRGRGRGVADALLAGIETWATGHGDLLRLEVHEHNARARAFYESRGFVLTGRTVPYPLPPAALELEMVKPLARHS